MQGEGVDGEEGDDASEVMEHGGFLAKGFTGFRFLSCSILFLKGIGRLNFFAMIENFFGRSPSD